MDSGRWQRVVHLYESVLEREPAERSAFLAQASAGDDELRREVESLLSQDSAPPVIDRPLPDVAAPVLDEQPDLRPGTQLGPYRIDHLVGAGGMGQVYRATDTRLARTVAIKILPRALASNPQFRARFDREAQAIAALTHPHICTLHDISHQDGVDFLVMEYLEGETLAARLARGPLPLDQALTYATECADALAAAHRQGIVHRDLKPGNIILTKGGAKLLDFGLAKPASLTVAHGSSITRSMTPPSLTARGTILGTLQYMAPEQLDGKEADARSDIFAFGAVVYEMLTGKKAFGGKSEASLIGAIMHAEPAPITASQPHTPPALERLVKTCLAKDPDARWHSARDLWHELRWIGHETTKPAPSGRLVRRRLLWACTLAGVLGFVVGGLLLSNFLRRDLADQAPGLQPLQMGISGPGPAGGMTFYQANNSLALSPDGRYLALASGGRLFLRAMDSLALTPVAGSEGGASPEWSPDGRHIAFLAQGKLKRVDVRTGSVLVLADAHTNSGISWSATGTILFPGMTPEAGPAILKTDSDGRNPTVVLAPDPGKGEAGLFWPQFLPDGRHFLYVTLRVDATARSLVPTLRSISIDGADLSDVGNVASRAVFDRAGYLLYARDGALFAQPFDPAARRLTGEPALLADRFHYYRSTGLADFAISHTGVLVLRTPPSPSRLVWLDRQGTEVGRLGDEALYGEPRISADGTRVVVDISDPALGTGDLWIFDRALGTSVRVTHSPADERVPIWSPDGRTLFFASDAAGPPDLYRRFLDSGREELLLRTPGIEQPTDISPDGREMLFYKANRAASGDLWRLRLDGSGQVAGVQQSPAVESSGRFSPDGRWVTYDSNESGRFEAYIESLDNPGLRWKVSRDGGINPEWGAGGAELFFVGAGSQLMSIPIRTKPSFQPGTPHPLFLMTSPFYSVLPGASRFLVVAPSRAATPPIGVIVNWRAWTQRSTP